MIKTANVELLYDFFARIFTMAYKKKVSTAAFETMLINSPFVNDLENNDDSFLFKSGDVNELIRNSFKMSNSDIAFAEEKMIVEAYWAAEAYLRLFFHFNKSFSFIFMYLPIAVMREKFKIYHEMDWSQLFNFFEQLMNEDSILTLTYKRHGLTIQKLSVLTGINIETLKKYAQNNDYIYQASYSNIVNLSSILAVKPNIFAKTLNIYLDSSVFEFDKKDYIYRSFLGLYYLSYFYPVYAQDKWDYQIEGNYFVSNKQQYLIVRSIDNNTDNYLFNVIKDVCSNTKNLGSTTLLLFDNQIDNKYIKSQFINFPLANIFIVNKNTIFAIKHYRDYSFDNYFVNVAIIRRAKIESQKIKNTIK